MRGRNDLESAPHLEPLHLLYKSPCAPPQLQLLFFHKHLHLPSSLIHPTPLRFRHKSTPTPTSLHTQPCPLISSRYPQVSLLPSPSSSSSSRSPPRRNSPDVKHRDLEASSSNHPSHPIPSASYSFQTGWTINLIVPIQVGRLSFLSLAFRTIEVLHLPCSLPLDLITLPHLRPHFILLTPLATVPP